ncbi:MAG: hypothetical protein HYS87_01390 [Candidatus Colwellbacteria bacterium]|nr:hypothetical protein [Candidatus Colwellbacteria bacterium]
MSYPAEYYNSKCDQCTYCYCPAENIVDIKAGQNSAHSSLYSGFYFFLHVLGPNLVY